MKINAYSSEYSSFNPKVLERRGRIRIGKQIEKLLGIYLSQKKLVRMRVLDMGCASGIVSGVLAERFGEVIGIDIDERAIMEARKNHLLSGNLRFYIKSAVETGFPNNSFDVVVANQLYYCFKKPEDLFQEIHRVLKPGGICFLGARNKYTLWDAQFHLPFLSFLPKKCADWVVKKNGRGDGFDVSYRNYWDLEKLSKKFNVVKYTPVILNNPKKYGFKSLARFHNVLSKIPVGFWRITEPVLPNFIWILEKD